MGVIPLQFREGESAKSLGLTGEETFDIRGIAGLAAPKQWVDVVAHGASGDKKISVLVRVDNETEMEYLSQGGVLPYVYGKLHTSGQ